MSQDLLNQDPIVSHSPDLLLRDNIFCNTSGYVRLLFVQRSFGFRTLSRDVVDGDKLIYVTDRVLDRFLLPDDLQTITEQFVKWRDQREVIPIKYTFVDQTIHHGDEFTLPPEAKLEVPGVYVWKDKYGLGCSYYRDVWFDWSERCKHSFRVTPKRGNDVYTDIVRKRFEPALSAPNNVFFDPSWGVKKTPMLYLTLTTDPVVVDHDVGKAWLRFGKWWNSFITNLRNQYPGKISYIRSWQSQDNYSPHCHVLLYFQEKDFTAVPWIDRDGGQSFRLPSRSHDREAIKQAWKWGSCDIQCVADTQTAYKDLLKYVTKDLEGGASDKTNGMVWFFEKRAFAISGDYFNILKGATDEPSVADLISADMDNSNSKLVRIDIYPIMGADIVPKNWQNSLIEGDPPPELVGFFANLELQLDYRECKPGKNMAPGCRVYLWDKVKGGKF